MKKRICAALIITTAITTLFMPSMFFSIMAPADMPPANGIAIPIQKKSEPISTNPQSRAISPPIRIAKPTTTRTSVSTRRGVSW